MEGERGQWSPGGPRKPVVVVRRQQFDPVSFRVVYLGVMKQGDSIDVWFGIGDGESRKLNGEYVSEDSIRIVDVAFLGELGFDAPWEYEHAARLPENRWVSYDDFAWSPLGEVPESDLVSGYLSPRHVEEKSFGGKVRFHKVFDL